MQRDDTGEFRVINEETGAETKFALRVKKSRKPSSSKTKRRQTS
jgi:hypothetical protein